MQITQNYLSQFYWCYLFILFTLGNPEVNAQTKGPASALDPVETKLRSVIDMTDPQEQFPVLMELALAHTDRMNPFTVQYLRDSLVSKSKQDPIIPSAVNFLIGEFLNINLQKFEQALFFYNKAIQLIPRSEETLQLRIWERITSVALHKAKLEMAIQAADSCINMANRQNKHFTLAHCLRCKGEIRQQYFKEPTGQNIAFSAAIENYNRSYLENLDRQDTLAALLNLYFISSLQLEMDSIFPQAQRTINTAFALITPDEKFDDFRAQNWYLRGKLLLEKNQLSGALNNFISAYEQFVINEDNARMMQTKILIGDILYRRQNNEEAILALDTALMLYPNVGSIEDLLTIHLLRYQTHKASGDAVAALSAHEDYVAAQHEVFRTDQLRLLSAMEAERRLQEKQAELNEKQNQIEKQTLLTQNLFIWSLALLLGIAIILFNFIRARKRRNELQDRNTIIIKQKQQLETLDNLKSRFFTNISHELRTPLTLIKAPLEYLQRKFTLPEDASYYLNTALNNTTHMQKLVNELLDFSKIKSGKITAQLGPADVDLVIREIVAGFAPLAESRATELLYHPDITTPIPVWIDMGGFQKILTNLISNALKFSPQDSRIEVGLAVEGRQAVVSVKDNGPGIYPDDLPYIFDRFHQSKHADVHQDNSTGIGLSLSAELAGLMNGRLWVESERGTGSTFFLGLPLADPDDISLNTLKTLAQSQSVPGKAKESSWANFPFTPDDSAYYVLIVEDHEDLRNYLANLLGEYFEVKTVSNGKEAMDLLEDPKSPLRQPGHSLIISDLMMPVMNGFELLEKLKADERFSNIPVLMLTAHQDRSKRLQALTVGVDDYLVKPFDNQELLIRVRNIIFRYWERVKQNSSHGEGKRDEGSPRGVGQNHNSLDKEQLKWLKELEAFSIKHISDSQFNVSFLSHFANMSERSFQRHIKKVTGLTPSEYIKEIRLHHARQLLESGSVKSVKAVSKAVGFSSHEYFSDIFQNRFGRRPSTYLG